MEKYDLKNDLIDYIKEKRFFKEDQNIDLTKLNTNNWGYYITIFIIIIYLYIFGKNTYKNKDNEFCLYDIFNPIKI